MIVTSVHRLLPVVLAAWCTCAAAQDRSLPEVRITAPAGDAVGTQDAASAGSISAGRIAARALLRPAEVLELVPGLVVTQHSGDGKANQYFLRGFNLDHGTDFATWVDGMPANMPTHAHGQGYTDLNWLIPELVQRIDWRKGPYQAEDGDFSSAGSARIGLVDRLPRPVLELGTGPRGWQRALAAGSTALSTGHLLMALEQTRNNGPWTVPEGLQRSNAVLRWSAVEGPSRWSLTGMAYAARWTATDQIPQRALDSGALGRFDAVNPTDGGSSDRTSLSWNWQRTDRQGEWRASLYALRSRLQLWSDFTYALDDAVNGDQFAQREQRQVLGGSVSRQLATPLAGRDGVTTVGLQWRHDRLDPVALDLTAARQTLSVLQSSRVRQSGLGLWVQNETQWLPWLRSAAGLRADRVLFDVDSSIAANSGRRDAAIASPRLSLVLGPWRDTEVFLNTGWGFHSNDARGTVATVSARQGLPIDPVTPLARTRGSELGLRTQLAPGLTSTLALWQLRIASELVFSGDAGETEPSRASLRRGIEWSTRWQPVAAWRMDADLAWSRARFTEDDPAGPYVPGAAGRVAALAATWTPVPAWSAQLQLRHIGRRALIEDGSVWSPATSLLSLRLGWQATPRLRWTLDAFNLANRRASDIDYWYVSRLPGEAAGGVADRHLHPVEPRTVRLALRIAL